MSEAAPIRDCEERQVRFPELDPATLGLAQKGDLRAKRSLVERYQRAVTALIARMLRGNGHTGLVEDLAQETFLRVFRALPKFDPGGRARLSTWILTIATRRTIDELRRRRLTTRTLEGASVDPRSRADEAAERRMLARVIDAAVQDLAPEYRAAFILREYHGLEYADIATALEVDLGTVKSRLNRARRRLREALLEVYHA